MLLEKSPFISIVVPLFNEEESLNALYDALEQELSGITEDYEIVLVDDGSRDRSFELVKELYAKNNRIKGLSFSRNFGHQIALMAGLQHATGQAVITMDADLQHPPSLIPVLIQKWQEEKYDIVNTRRLDADGIGFFKKISSKLYYRLLNYLSDIHIEPAAADFRLMNRKSLDAFLNLPERDRFTRGLVSWMGFNQAIIDYKAQDRFAGSTKYSFFKMLRFGLDGIVSFSSRPLRLSFYAGFFIFLFGLLYAFYAIVQFIQGTTVPGWTSILVSLLVIGGVMLLSLGIIGEYIARIFHEVKQRPLYFIKEKVGTQINSNEQSEKEENQ